MKKFTPWWLRIPLKLVLSRLPFTYKFWKRLQLFEHGDMHLPARSLETFLMHAKTADVLANGGKSFEAKDGVKDSFNVLELGPGDALYTGLISVSLGASHTWLVDTGEYAVTDLQSYFRMRDHLLHNGYSAPNLKNVRSFSEYTSSTRTTYLTDGVRSLRSIPDSSIDFCFSNAVLEHVNVDDFGLLISELKRILRSTSSSCHRVDLKDHLGGGLNSLRFSKDTWEGSLFKSSGFYTNRIRFNSYISMFCSAGFDVKTPRIVRWETVPIQRSNLDSEFIDNSEDDLLVSGFDMVLKLKSE